MISAIVIILTSLQGLQSEEFSFEDFVAIGKCPLTKVETHIFHARYLNNSQVYLPRLKDLKLLYPGDKFTVSPENSCVDESPLCAKAVNNRACIGLDTKVTQCLDDVREGGSY